MKLWLDDLRPAPEGWTWVKTPMQAIGALLGDIDDPVTHMSFDHDLGIDPAKFDAYTRGEIEEHEAEITGYQVALWMAEHDVWPTVECMVHSMNPVGAKNICGVVDRYGPYTTLCTWNGASF